MFKFISKQPFIDWLVAAGLFGLALWLRTTDLVHFVTADEHNWIYRSGLFLNALLRQDWPGTSVWYTPAVTTTWLGSAGLAIFYQTHQESINQPLVDWLVSFSRNKIDLDILLALRWSIALFTSTMAVVVYGLARKLWPLTLALLGTLLLITEPHILAVSRIIGHDALVTLFVISSLLSFLYAKRLLLCRFSVDNFLHEIIRRRWFMVSGLFAGLAILSKVPALILIPFTVLMAVADTWQHRNRLSRWIWAVTIWGGVLCLTFILAWPAAWTNPLGQLWYVVSSAFFSSTGSEDADIQPYWSIPDLGYFYYLVNGAFKASPFLLIGAILAGIGGWRKIRRERLSWSKLAQTEFFWLALFAALFTAMMTLGAKKSPRYILPVFPALTFLAAWGWFNLSTLPPVANRHMLRRLWQPGIIIVLSLIALGLTLPYAPYYFTYYNPLLGGSFTAPKVVRVGWGEGLDEVGRWLDAQPDAAAGHIGTRYTVALYPFYQGNISSPVSDELDYVVFYIKQTQSGYPSPEILAYFENREALHRVALNGIEYAQVYPGPAMQPVQAGGEPGLPIAYRPYTIYAPIGQRLTIDLLWADNSTLRPAGDSVKLAIESADLTTVLESPATIIKETAGVRVSTHHFNLPSDLNRNTYALLVNGKSLGQIKARLLDVPAGFRPFSAVLAGQLKLAGFRQHQNDNHLLVDLAWQAWPKAANNYTVFVQLLDKQGQRIAGVDVVPERGFTALDRKEIMVMHYDILLPDDLPADSSSILVGLYYFAGDEIINVGAVTLPEPVILE